MRPQFRSALQWKARESASTAGVRRLRVESSPSADNARLLLSPGPPPPPQRYKLTPALLLLLPPLLPLFCIALSPRRNAMRASRDPVASTPDPLPMCILCFGGPSLRPSPIYEAARVCASILLAAAAAAAAQINSTRAYCFWEPLFFPRFVFFFFFVAAAAAARANLRPVD